MGLEDVPLLAIGNEIQLVGAAYSGHGQLFLFLLPSTTEGDPKDLFRERPVAIHQLDTDEWNTFLRQTDLMELEALVEDEHGVVKKAIVRKTARVISQHISWKVWRRDEFKCRYCGADDVPLTVDHLVLWEEGGPSIEENLLTACRKCNKARGNMQYADWLKSPRYRRTSEKLSWSVQDANAALVPTLDAIPRSPIIKKKR